MLFCQFFISRKDSDYLIRTFSFVSRTLRLSFRFIKNSQLRSVSYLRRLKFFPFRSHPDDSRRVDETSVLHLIMRFFALLAKSALIFWVFFLIRTVSFAICSIFALFFPKLLLIRKCINNDLKKYFSSAILPSGLLFVRHVAATPKSFLNIFKSDSATDPPNPHAREHRQTRSPRQKTAFQDAFPTKKLYKKWLRLLTFSPIQVIIPTTRLPFAASSGPVPGF